MRIVRDVVECCRSEAERFGEDPLVILGDVLELAILSGDQGKNAYARTCRRYERHAAYRLRSIGWRLLWSTEKAGRDLCGDVFRELWNGYVPTPHGLADLLSLVIPFGVPEPFFPDVDCRTGRVLMAVAQREPDLILHGVALTQLELRATALNLRALNVRGLVALGTVDAGLVCEAYYVGRTRERIGACKAVRTGAFSGVEARFSYTIPPAMKRRRVNFQKNF